jgi:hypothetical protein
MKKIVLIFILFVLLGFEAFAQEESKSKPFELPYIVVKGKGRVSVMGGEKQSPGNLAPMRGALLDSLNSLEKQQSLLLPADPIPSKILDYDYKRGYLRGGAGMDTRIFAKAGYGIKMKDYDVFGTAGLEMDGGNVKNAEYTKLGLDINSEYIAPEKYWIFGGSKTRTNIGFNMADYKLYANQAAPSRNLTDFNLGVDVDGNYGGFLFNTGAGFKTVQMSGDAGVAFDNNIQGFLSVKNLQSDYELGGEVILDLRNIRGASANYFQGNAIAGYIGKEFYIKAKAGFQAASNTFETSRGGFLLSGEMEYHLNMMLTIRGKIETGLEQNSFAGMARHNVYIANDAIVDFSYLMPKVEGAIFFHPTEKISVVGRIGFKSTDRMPIFIINDNKSFDVLYDKVTTLSVGGEVIIKASDDDNFIADLGLDYSDMSTLGDIMPYSVPMQAAFAYERNWSEMFGTDFGLVYVGQRYADLENKVELDSYINLKASAYLRLDNSIKIFFNFENLLNSDILIWQGYKEKGLFVVGGIMWQF